MRREQGMPRYRRRHIAGGLVYFEVCLARRGDDLLVREIDTLRWAVGCTLRDRPVQVVAWVVLPDRMHAIWRLPDGDCAYGLRWGAIKARFTRSLRATASGHSPDLRHDASGAEAKVWQNRFWEHHIRGPDDLAHHMHLCRVAPVRAGLVRQAEDWPFSSFAGHRQGGSLASAQSGDGVDADRGLPVAR